MEKFPDLGFTVHTVNRLGKVTENPYSIIRMFPRIKHMFHRPVLTSIGSGASGRLGIEHLVRVRVRRTRARRARARARSRAAARAP